MKLFFLLVLPAAALGAGALLGAPQKVDQLSANEKEIVDFAFSQLAGSAGVAGGSQCGKKFVRVENFTSQVVSGMLYKFDLVLDQECDKETKSCKMVVYDQPWTQTREVQWDKVVCGNAGNDGSGSDESSQESEESSQNFAESAEDSSESNKEESSSEKISSSSELTSAESGENSSSTSSSESVEELPTPQPAKLPRVKLASQKAGGVVSSVLRRFQKLSSQSEEIEFNLLGGEQPKFLPHYKRGYGYKWIGGDDHDFVPHGKPLLGGDDHDVVPHGKPLLCGDDHDFVPHGKPLLGGDDHDAVPHGKPLLGGDGHDYAVHPLVGGGEAHGPKFDENVEYPPVDDNDDFMMRKLPPMEVSLKRLKEMQSVKSFHSFMNVHNKVYKDKAEYLKRYAIFKDNMKKVQFLQETELGTGVYGATHLADITETEFKQHYLGINMKKDDPDIHWPAADIPDVDLPTQFDWRTKNAVTPVKNQGMCGSCWAFSVTGNVEGQYAIKNKKLVSLSEQELVDCDKRDAGCNGGLPENAYKTLLEIGGLESEEEYGYDGADEKCKFNRTKVVARVSGGVEISQNETQMAQWLLKNGPISVGLNANAMQFYMGGVSHPWKFLCSPDGIDHGVLIVGFGIHDYPLFHKKMPYWIIKNSWGPGWGEQGYYRLYRGDGTCGINMMTSSAVLAK